MVKKTLSIVIGKCISIDVYSTATSQMYVGLGTPILSYTYIENMKEKVIYLGR